MKKANTILLVGGGTSGHAAPLYAIYKKLQEKNPDLKIVAVGVGTREERVFLDKIPNYRKISTGKLHRFLTLRNISEALKFIQGFFQSISILLYEKPAIIFSKGGFVAFPLISAAKLLSVPYFQHESDMEMGRANKSMSKRAKKVFVSFPDRFYPNISSRELIFSGPILRPGFEESKEAEKKYFGFPDDDPIIFLTGGSQGSLNLSNNFLGIAQDLLNNYNIIHQAGRHSIEVCRQFQKSLSPEKSKKYFLTEFLEIDTEKDRMNESIEVSDLIISRAGSTICELAVKGKPMLLIPWQHSASDHQNKNAKFFSENNAAVVLNEKELSPEKLLEQINNIFSGDRKALNEISVNAQKLFPTNGVDIICEEILKNL